MASMERRRLPEGVLVMPQEHRPTLPTHLFQSTGHLLQVLALLFQDTACVDGAPVACACTEKETFSFA